MVLGIGTDIIEIARVQQVIQKSAFVHRVFTKAECAYCEGRGKQAAASYAARFAAKEAVLKSLGTGLRGGTLLDIEVSVDALGAPHIALHGCFEALAKEMGVKRIWVSMSHSREYATAQCVMEGCK